MKKTITQTNVEATRLIQLLRETSGKKLGSHREMLMKLMESNETSNPKKLRKFLELVLEEIDKIKILRGI